jgi:hypothetical protein
MVIDKERGRCWLGGGFDQHRALMGKEYQTGSSFCSGLVKGLCNRLEGLNGLESNHFSSA